MRTLEIEGFPSCTRSDCDRPVKLPPHIDGSGCTICGSCARALANWCCCYCGADFHHTHERSACDVFALDDLNTDTTAAELLDELRGRALCFDCACSIEAGCEGYRDHDQAARSRRRRTPLLALARCSVAPYSSRVRLVMRARSG